MAVLPYASVLRIHASLVRRRTIARHVCPRLVRDALLLAREPAPEVRRAREEADPFGVSDARADEATAMLVAFAATLDAFGPWYDTLPVVDAIVHAQVERAGWWLDLTPDALEPLLVETAMHAETGRPIDYARTASELMRAMRRSPTRRATQNPPRGVRRTATRPDVDRE
jgi:hypothetical protein